MTNDEDIANVAKAVGDTAVDLLILNAGIMGEKDEESGSLRKLGNLKRADFLNVFNVNVVCIPFTFLIYFEPVSRINRPFTGRLVACSSDRHCTKM